MRFFVMFVTAVCVLFLISLNILININLKCYCEFIFFFNLLTYFTFYFILFQFTSVILGVVKIGGPWTRSMKVVHGPSPYFDGPGPWTRSTERVHGPGVHVLYFPLSLSVLRHEVVLDLNFLRKHSQYSCVTQSQSQTADTPG